MVPIRTGAAAAGAAMLLALPAAAHAAPTATPVDCAKAQAAAAETEKDYDAMKREYLALIADGGHPDASQRQALADADVQRSATAAEAERICDSV
ncbi:hypothetical protein [Streptomyces sp. NPDC000133]|uniref:hypothetical protein n=1 Tax=Streptomyces sp. NPDC000133 TaxID=3364535 RepID=UPI0036ACD17D